MWSTAVADESLGLIYLPMANPSGDYYSSTRSPEERKYGSSVTALDVETGKPRWVYQLVKNDVWDYDTPSQPSLVDFPTPSGNVPALVQTTKVGDIFILDRRTGQPLTKVEEVKAPQGGVEPAERAPTQLRSLYNTTQQPDITESQMWGISPIDQMLCRIQFRSAHYEGIFTPPSVDKPWIEYPGNNGGSDWGSLSVDVRRGVIVLNYNEYPSYSTLVPRAEDDKLGVFYMGDPRYKGPGPGDNRPQADLPYGISANQGWLMPTGVLCKQPPYGGIRAIALATGQTLWDHPFGTAQRNGPWGIPSMLPFEIGVPSNGGPVTTASGLIFVAATTDDFIRAIDLKTGKTIWSDQLPAGGQATPMVYEAGGKQYVVIMAGGHHSMLTPAGDYLVAYALPDRR
jgi:quinoprotein glucose dehydrogenase